MHEPPGRQPRNSARSGRRGGRPDCGLEYFRPFSCGVFHPLVGLPHDFVAEVAGRPLRTAGILVFQSSRSFGRFHPQWHGLFLEGGFDHEGRFVHVPKVDLQK